MGIAPGPHFAGIAATFVVVCATGGAALVRVVCMDARTQALAGERAAWTVACTGLVGACAGMWAVTAAGTPVRPCQRNRNGLLAVEVFTWCSATALAFLVLAWTDLVFAHDALVVLAVLAVPLASLVYAASHVSYAPLPRLPPPAHGDQTL